MTTYVTFGQIHRHEIGDKVFDKDCIAAIESENITAGRIRAFQLFKRKWHNTYWNEQLTPEILEYFPRGIIKVDD